MLTPELEPMTTPLHERRAPEIEARIDQEFELIKLDSSRHCRRFNSVGRENDYEFELREGMVSAIDVIKNAAEADSNKDHSIRILDIGGANCHMLLQAIKNHGKALDCTTINAVDYLGYTTSKRAKKPKINQILANAERMIELELEPFDLIFSRLAFAHFADPLGGIEQAARMLKPGGRLITDGSAMWPNTIAARLFNKMAGFGNESGIVETADHTMKWRRSDALWFDNEIGFHGLDIARKPDSSRLPLLFPMLEYGGIDNLQGYQGVTYRIKQSCLDDYIKNASSKTTS